jgi:hypothetical protein
MSAEREYWNYLDPEAEDVWSTRSIKRYYAHDFGIWGKKNHAYLRIFVASEIDLESPEMITKVKIGICRLVHPLRCAVRLLRNFADVNKIPISDCNPLRDIAAGIQRVLDDTGL